MNTVHIGDRIKIINMEGEPHYKDREGVVTHIDDAGQVHGTWGAVLSLQKWMTLSF